MYTNLLVCVSPSYVRYFNMLYFCQFDTDALGHIFSTITTWFLSRFNSACRMLTPNLVAASVSLYHTLSETLLPTPAKSHYTFNLRDLSKVFQGIACGNPKDITTSEDLIRYVNG